MDAATPFRRRLRIACLCPALLAGCSLFSNSSRDTDSRQPSAIQTRNLDPRYDIAEQERQKSYIERGYKDTGPSATLTEWRDANAAMTQPNQPRPVTARPQAPTEPPGPLAPVAPPPPVAPAAPPGPVSPAAVMGSPVPPPLGGAVQAGFTPSGAGRLRPAIPDTIPRVKVVAVVGAGNIVTDREVIEAVRQRIGEYVRLEGSERDVKEAEVYRDCLKKIIDRELILDDMFQRLKKNGKAGVIEEVKEMGGKAADFQLRHFKKEYKAKSDDEFKAILASQELTLPVIRRQLERQVMADEYVKSMLREKGIKTGLAEVRDYYTRHPQQFQSPDRVKWLDIFISFNRFPTPRAAYDHAEAVRQQAAAGVDFVALSKQHDHGVAGRQNGEGTGSARGKILPVDVEPTVWALQPGQVSGLIETPSGYHIVKVVERDRAGLRPLDEKTQAAVRDKIREQRVMQERAKLLDTLWRKGGVQVIDAPK